VSGGRVTQSHRSVSAGVTGRNYLQPTRQPWTCRCHDGSGHNHQAYLWQIRPTGSRVVFGLPAGAGREGPKEFLDGSRHSANRRLSAYDGVAGEDGACPPAAHARRKFSRRPSCTPAMPPRAHGGADRPVFRDRARRASENWIARAATPVRCLKCVGKAAKYTLTLWGKLTRFRITPKVELGATPEGRTMARRKRRWARRISSSARH